jgi:hypothetical protein
MAQKKERSSELGALFYTFSGDRGGIRTPNPQSRNLIFYPVELRSQNFCARFMRAVFLLVQR